MLNRSEKPSQQSQPKRPEFTICSEFWFVDGNVVILAVSSRLSKTDHKVAFKVHRGQLLRHSEVFDSLFQLPPSCEPCPQELFEGLPCVMLHDCPSDMFYFLGALYDGLYFQSPRRASDFTAVAAVLRLSTKYFVEHLRRLCLERLEMDWPKTLRCWDFREKEATDEIGHYSPRDFCPHPILLIELALELDLPEFLPAAFYDLSRYGPSKVAGGTPSPQNTFISFSASDLKVPAIVRQLSIDMLHRTLQGREFGQQFLSKFVNRAVCDRIHSHDCYYQRDSEPGKPCYESFYFIALNLLRSVGGISCGRDADPLYTLLQAIDMLTRTDFSDGRSCSGLKICAPCKIDFEEACRGAREAVWSLLPVWFGMSSEADARGMCRA
ncbi:hypothetical protein C8J56DRAFT_795563 [Mycena floridula]|nr:hypothetical protein C8J56DRAFT_795563 [Mycena floridula]